MLTKDALAGKLGVRPGTVGRWEAGDVPSPRSISAICMLFGVHADYFLPDGFAGGDPMPFFRTPTKVDSLAQRSAAAYSEVVAEMMSLLAIHQPFPATSLPTIDVDAVAGVESIQAAAILTRTHLGVMDGPMPNLVRTVEDKGVLVAFSPMKEAEPTSPYCRWIGERGVIILSAQADNYYRQRFDVAHEVGHLVMHRSVVVRDRNTENQAHQFAAELLMPHHEIAGFLPTVTTRGGWRLLAELKERWGVSLAALLHRARELDVMSDVTYRNALSRIRREGWDAREPGRVSEVEAISALPERLRRLSYTEAQSVRKIVGMSESEFNSHLNGRPKRAESLDH